MNYDKDNIEFQPLPTAHNFINITGQRFIRLTVIGYAGRSQSKRQEWWCKCDCGAITKVRQGNLHSAQVTSCGCLRDEKIGALNRTHGLTKRHPLYVTWCNMRRRCYDVNCPKYRTHGKRGIQVCQHWRASFPNFLADMGDKPSRTHSVERVDNNAHYSCGHCDECHTNGWAANCIWATPKIQGGNTRSNHVITFNGKTQILSDWAREVGMSPSCLMARINRRKWSIEKALTTPVYIPTASAST